MATLHKTARGEQDLDEIWDYIAADNLERAASFLRDMDEQMKTLAKNPMMGRTRDDLATGLRSFPFESYVIFYRPIKNGVEVVRVLHGSRDIPSLF